MFKRFSFWIWGAIVTQLLTSAFHSLSFFVKQEPTNETEKQLLEITGSYKADLGMGFHRSFAELFTAVSLCFTLICLFGGILNWYFKKKNLTAALWKGLLLIEMVIFGAMFIAMLAFAFFPPIVCTGLIFIFVSGAYLSVNNK
jgi:hypothetical protein